MEKNHSVSHLSGFINGYKASNIARIESSIKYHVGEINDKVKSLIGDNNIDDEILNPLKKISYILDDADSNYTDILIQFGEAFKLTILLCKNKNMDDVLNDPKIKMIIYHYLELAEKIEDKRLNNLAIAIGELL